MHETNSDSKRLFSDLMGAATYEERVKILERERQRGRQEFPVQLAKLENLLLRYNPLIILAQFGFYDLTYLPDVGRMMNESDPIEQYHIEFIQALILCHEQREFGMAFITPVEFQEFRDLTIHVAYLHSAKDFPDHHALDGNKAHELEFRAMLRAHTKGVRNWGYEDQTFRVLRGLYEPLDGAAQEEYGVRFSVIIDLVLAQLKKIGERIQEHFTKVKSFMQHDDIGQMTTAYLNVFPDKTLTVAEVQRLITNDRWPVDNVRLMIMNRSTRFLLEVFAFNVSEFVDSRSEVNAEAVASILAHWSLEWGDLRQCKRDHILLDNPIWRKPILRARSDIFYWPVSSLFHSFCFEMLDSLVAAKPRLVEKFRKERGNFLERYTLRLLQKRFPEAKFFAGSKWKNEKTGEEGENDLLVVLDSVAVVIEAKSGGINRVAKRGGPSLKQEIEQLIAEPARQAEAFVNILRDGKKHAFATDAGHVNEIDASVIKNVLCLSITLERFSTIATQLPRLQAAGLLAPDAPLVPSMSVADLEIGLQLFDTPFEFLHYLTRRCAFELKRTFLGDELDLLAFYLKTGFASKLLPDTTQPIVINGLGRNLNPFFMTGGQREQFPRPQRNLSDWWRELLREIDVKRTYRRYEAGCLLLDMPDDEQQAFETQFLQLCEKVKLRGTCDLDNVEAIWNVVESDRSKAVVLAAPVTTDIYPKRKAVVEGFAARAMEETKTDQVLIILVDVEQGHWPYSGMYLLDRGEAQPISSGK